MRYPLSKFVLVIAIAAWAFNARPFSFVLWSALVSFVLYVLAYAWEKREANAPLREAIRKDRAGVNKSSELERLRDSARSIL